MPIIHRRRLLGLCVSGLIAGITSGCGTIMYPERKGQPAGMIDWKVAALNGLGLMFFFVPGVIAFAVDFNNGTIYLPQNSYGATDFEPSVEEFNTVQLPSDQLTQQEIGLAVSKHSGHEVNLISGEYQTEPLNSIDDFWAASQAMNNVKS